MDGIFYSYQWGELINNFFKKKIFVNIAQIYLSTSMAKNSTNAINIVKKFNKNAHEISTHNFLDSFLSATIFIKILKTWVHCFLLYFRVAEVCKLSKVEGLEVFLWPVLEAQFKSSIYGQTCMSNLVAYELFEAMLKDAPKQKLGIYLCENQGWEVALLHAWRKNGHGKLIGANSTTIPFWHLYNFNDPLLYLNENFQKSSMPDVLAVNGDHAYDAMYMAGYPEDKLYRVEALRYSNLPRSLANEGCQKIENVLIIGEYSGDSMAKMMAIIESLILRYRGQLRFTYKPHPACQSNIPIAIKSYIHITRAPLQDIFPDIDLVIGGNSTSGVIDAIIYGLPTVVYHDPCQLNLSPLFNTKDAKFFSNLDELSGWISEMSNHLKYNNSGISDSFFYTKKDLSLWNSLILDLGYS